MKRLKLLPSILMLVLCVGVLCMGIYAASPNSNQITGQITINAANAQVEISGEMTGALDNTQKLDAQTTRTGTTWDIKNALAFNTNKNSVDEVEDIVIEITITNKSDRYLGAYFFKGTLPSDGYATADNVILDLPIYDDNDTVDISDDTENIANAMLAPYTFLNKQGETGDSIVMEIRIKLVELFESEKNGYFDIFLNIEDYVAGSDSTGRLYKNSPVENFVEDDIDSYAWLNAPNVEIVVATCHQKMNDVTFYNLDNMIAVSMPETVVGGGSAHPFCDGCTGARFYVQKTNTGYRNDAQGNLYQINYDNCGNDQLVTICREEEIIIENGTKGVCYGAFTGKTNLKVLTIPNSVTSWNEGCLDGAYNIEYIRLVAGENTQITDTSYQASFPFPTLSKTGYTFNGWFETDSLENAKARTGGTKVTSVSQRNATKDMYYYTSWSVVEN